MSQTASSRFTHGIPSLSAAVLSWNSFLLRFSTLLIAKLLFRPISFILWPSIFILALSYPAIYNISLSPQNFLNSIFSNSSNKLISVQITDKLLTPHTNPDLVMKTYSFYQDNIENLLNIDFLSQLHNIQSILFQNISIDNENIIVHSPLQYWNNDLDILQRDSHILKTIQLKSSAWLQSNSFHSLNNFQLFSGITKLDGLIKSASLLRIVLLYPHSISNSMDTILSNNLQLVQDKYSQLNILVQNVANNQLIKVSYQSCKYIDFAFIYACLFCLIFYYVYQLKRLKLIHSKIGIIVAVIVQYITTFLASLSLISIFNTDFEFLQIPFILVNLLPLLITFENSSRLLFSITDYSNDLSFTSRITTSINHSFNTSINFNIFSILIISLYAANSTTVASSSYSYFLIVFTVLNYISTYTFFLTTLLIDTSKVEHHDLIQLNIKPNNESKIKNLGYRLNPPLLKLLTLQNNYFNIGLLLFVSSTVFNWTNGITLDISNMTLSNTLNFFLNKRGFAYELLRLSKKKNDVLLAISPSIYLSNLNELPKITSINYNYDIFCILEYLSFLLFTVSTLLLILKFTINKESQKSKFLKLSNISLSIKKSKNDALTFNQLQSFQSKDLVKGHVLDIVKLCTSSCPFIVSVGIDHKILVWSPLKIPTPIPTQLPISMKFLPVSHIVMSESGSFITVFSRSGEIKCWSRLSMSWVWSIQLNELSNDIPLESFFRRRTHVSSGRRKLVSRNSRSSSSSKFSNIHPTIESSSSNRTTTKPISSRQTPPPPLRNPSKLSTLAQEENTTMESTDSNIIEPIKSSIRKISNSMRSTRALSLDSNFDQSVNLNKLTYNSDMEFIIVTRDGSIFTIDCTSGSLEKTSLNDCSILCAKKLLSPRVNDRIVAVKENGELIVSTAINNKWISRLVKIDSNSYNKGNSLMKSGILAESQEFNYSTSPSSPSSPSSSPSSNKTSTIRGTVLSTKKVDFNDDSLYDFKGLVMETVPFVGMIVRAFGSKCQLIDVQTGIVLKEWKIGNFKLNTFKVFHPEPSHCRFCGCASVPSFSVSYTELETNCLILHTFSIDNRAKNNICLRVERDSRETRCLGFANVTEHQHWLSNVESWCSTDLNILMGVRKKDKKHDSNDNNGDNDESGELIKSFSTKVIDINNDKADDHDSNATTVKNIFELSQIGLRKRNNKISLSASTSASASASASASPAASVSVLSSPLQPQPSSSSPIDNDENIDDSNKLNNDSTTNTVHRLSDIWEGWTMSADGTVRIYEIPDGSYSGLLVKKLGPVCKFGHKSIVVSFGNIMKVLYLGNDNLIEEGESNDERPSSSTSSSISATSSTLNPSSSSLSFINRRRKLRMKKYDLTHSTNFEDQNDNPDKEISVE